MSLPRYPEYKSSGLTWLGDIPSHWYEKRVKFVLAEAADSIKIGPFGSQLTSDMLTAEGYKVYGQENVIAQDFGRGARFISAEKHSELSAYSVVPGDILITMMGTSGRCSIVPPYAETGVMDSHLLRLRLSADIHPAYFQRLIDEAAYVAHQVSTLGKGSIMHGLNSGIVKQLSLAVPPHAEQVAIATFLDRETAKIDALIAEQEKLIALLAEKRQATISHAVTKGLNPNAPMKDSGVAWLGEVPAHWEVTRLKFIASVQTGIAKGKDTSGKKTRTVPYLRVANVQDGYLALDDVATIDIEVDQLERYRLATGDVLMNEGGDFDKLGRGAIWRGAIEDCIHQNHVFAVRPCGVSSEWLNGITSSQYAQFYFMSRSKQSTNLASISSTNIMELPVVLPPAHEQEAILAFVDREISKLDRLRWRSAKAIDLLGERRSALIAAAVTGQIDVRRS